MEKEKKHRVITKLRIKCYCRHFESLDMDKAM